MKKIILSFLIIMMILPYYVNAENCDPNKISISSITIENKLNKAEEIETATINGKKIYLNLSMLEVGDSIKYRIIVKNDSNEDYELEKNSLNINSDYIKYTFASEDKSNIVKAKSRKEILLNVEYYNEVPSENFESGTFNDKKRMKINLSTEKSDNIIDTLKNPKTGIQLYIVILFFVLLIGITAYISLRKKKYTMLIILLVGISIITPISINAICNSGIIIESNVQIKNNTFTGTLYRYNNIKLKNGSSISGYLLKGSDAFRSFLFNSKEECDANVINDEVCEKVQGSILSYPGFTIDKETLNKNVFLRHNVVNNIIKSTTICYLDNIDEYCMQGGDNGNSFSLNEQVIRNFNHHNSSCVMNVRDNVVGCFGSYGMEMNAYKNGKISAYYIFGVGCDIESDSTSSCWSN